MSPRTELPRARVSRSHFFLTLARGDNMRCLAVRPWALYATAGLFPLCGVLYFSASVIFIMRDDVVSAVYQRQQVMQQAYEDRLAEMRAQVDRVSSRQLLDQNSLEGKMHELISRQAVLETRTAVVAKLTESISGSATSSIKRQTRLRAPVPPKRPAAIGTQRQAGVLPSGASSYASTAGLMSPASLALGAALGKRPRPHAVEVVPAGRIPAAKQPDCKVSQLGLPNISTIAGDERLPVELRIGALAQSLDLIAAQQLRKVARIGQAARQKMTQLREVIASTGLSPDKLRAPKTGQMPSATGGPFVPFKLDPNGPAFERAVLGLQTYIVEANRLQRLVRHLPVSRPLPAHASMTSGFGQRADPFNGRIAIHTGLDFRDHYGAPVHATAAGRVVKASYQGGYGKLVELDHGNGISTRYAHLSAISVSKGQWVKLGRTVGKIGSTGRSTGAHLHYEVRINDRPVNPLRFIRAGQKL